MVILRILLSVAVVLCANSAALGGPPRCRGEAERVLKEVEGDGGTEVHTLRSLHATCAGELQASVIPAEARFPLSRIQDTISSWEEMQAGLKNPPRSMKTVMREQRQDIASKLAGTLRELIAATE